MESVVKKSAWLQKEKKTYNYITVCTLQRSQQGGKRGKTYNVIVNFVKKSAWRQEGKDIQIKHGGERGKTYNFIVNFVKKSAWLQERKTYTFIMSFGKKSAWWQEGKDI